ncbi:hypothetical protein GC176_17520 [bacterium]|nr:hypothetical protein [bacterium]
MPNCDYCNSYIIFGGKKQGGRTFCNDKCLQNGYLLTAADRLPQDAVDMAVEKIHQGECPRCRGPGPVDVHVAHTVWSALYLTSWKSKPHLCCKSCGRKQQLGGLFFSGLLGWWGFPWGLIMAPVQIVRNISGMFGGPDPEVPSEQLETLARIDLAERIERGERLPGARPQKSSAAEEPIAVECEACGKRFKAKAQMAGRTGKCPGCGSSITVPEPEADVWEDEHDEWDFEAGDDGGYSSADDDEYGNSYDDEWNDRSPRRRSSSGKRSPATSTSRKVIVVLASVTAGLFAIGAVTAVGMLLAGGNQKPAPPGAVPPFAQNNAAFGRPDGPGPNAESADLNATGPQRGSAPKLPDHAGASATGPANGTPSVDPLPNADSNGRLWVVLSNLRALPGGRPSGFNRPFQVDYQIANGTPDKSAKYVLHVLSSRGGGSLTFYADVSVELHTSGTVQFVTPPTFGSGTDFEVTMAIPQGRNKWQDLSGKLSVGGLPTVAQPPPTIREVAGAEAQGKLLAIANPEFQTDSSPFPTLTVKFVLQQEASPTGYYFLVVEQSGGERVEFDVSRTLRQTAVNEDGQLGGRLLGAGAQIQPPLTLHVEKRESRIPSPIRREQPEIASNRVSLAG